MVGLVLDAKRSQIYPVAFRLSQTLALSVGVAILTHHLMFANDLNVIKSNQVAIFRYNNLILAGWAKYSTRKRAVALPITAALETCIIFLRILIKFAKLLAIQLRLSHFESPPYALALVEGKLPNASLN